MTFQRARAATRDCVAVPARLGVMRLLRFWLQFARQTLSGQRLSLVARARIGNPKSLRVSDARHLPASGAFVLAANHNRPGQSLDTIAALLLASELARPGLADEWLLIAGRASPDRQRLPARVVRAGLGPVFHRWRRNVLHLPLRNHTPLPSGLREWRRRASVQPSLVFPEGKARREFGAVRQGSGRWLASLGVPTIPAAVWLADGRWHVAFGTPLAWAARDELRDHQLGLAIAALLPPELAPGWQMPLARWRAAHNPAVMTTA